MNEYFKTKWLNALRSGEYKQGTNQLNTSDNKYCCLGVACDLLVKDGLLREENGVYISIDDEEDENDLELPNIAVKFMEVGSNDPTIQVDNNLLKDRPTQSIKEGVDVLFGDYSWTTLAAINDAGYTFNEIADIIEGQL